MTPSKKFIFTVDVEMHNANSKSNGSLWIAKLLKRYGGTGTFFITAEEMQKKPHFVEELMNQGHEIASHGYSHRGSKRGYEIPYLDQLGEKETREEIGRSYNCFKSRGLLVKGYRAPALRIRPEQLKIIGEYFEYDSSWNYRRNGEYKGQYSGYIRELPVSMLKPLPILAGSPYLFLGGFNFWKVFEKISRLTIPIVFYCHSFDVIKKGFLNHPKLNFFKKKIYYQHCGDKGIIFLNGMLDYLTINGWHIQSCMQFFNNDIN